MGLKIVKTKTRDFTITVSLHIPCGLQWSFLDIYCNTYKTMLPKVDTYLARTFHATEIPSGWRLVLFIEKEEIEGFVKMCKKFHVDQGMATQYENKSGNSAFD